MRLFILLLTFTFFPLSVFSEELDNQINKACLRHAVSLVAQLKADVVGELSQEKSDQALKLATDSCQAYFKKEFSKSPEAVAAAKNKSEDDDGVTDWLTKKILSGDTSRKEGNNRIKKIK